MNLLFEMLGAGKGLGQHALPSLVLLPVRPHEPSWANAQTCLSCLRRRPCSGASSGLGKKVAEKHAFRTQEGSSWESFKPLPTPPASLSLWGNIINRAGLTHYVCTGNEAEPARHCPPFSPGCWWFCPQGCESLGLGPSLGEEQTQSWQSLGDLLVQPSLDRWRAMAEEDKADLAPGPRPWEGCAWAQLESPPFPPSAWPAAFRFIINPEGSRAER